MLPNASNEERHLGWFARVHGHGTGVGFERLAAASAITTPFDTTIPAGNVQRLGIGQPVITSLVKRRLALALWLIAVLTMGGGILAASSRNTVAEALVADTALLARGGE